MEFEISDIGIDIRDYADEEKASRELEAYTGRMIDAIVRETDCSVGDAKNALIGPVPGSRYLRERRYFDEDEGDENPYAAELKEIRKSYPTEAALLSKTATYHHRAATTNYILGNKSVAAEHWLIYKLLLCVSVIGAIPGYTPPSSEQDSNEAIKRALSELGRRAADSAHTENRAMKAQALEHYAKNRHIYPNKDEAAQAITNLVPVSFATARKWLKGQ